MKRCPSLELWRTRQGSESNAGLVVDIEHAYVLRFDIIEHIRRVAGAYDLEVGIRLLQLADAPHQARLSQGMESLLDVI